MCLLCHLSVSLSGQVTRPVFLCYSVGGIYDDVNDIDTWADMTNIKKLCHGLQKAGQMEQIS